MLYKVIKILFLSTILSPGLLLTSCDSANKSISFYYWKTTFKLNSYEQETLGNNNVKTLYLRYFDVDFTQGSFEPEPVSPVSMDISTKPYRIVPVIYIKNRVFERVDSAGIRDLVENIFSFVSQINNTHNIRVDEIQFDCDWTATTRANYFYFINQYRAISRQVISATIRLHQVKYHQVTGIPPVDVGVLMFYNMGSINAGKTNSIYDKSIAGRYTSYIRSYPLKLDVALPIFLWSVQIRNGKVFQLLNKMNFSHFENDSNFNAVKKNWFAVKHDCFKGGYYFRQNDMIKIENVSTEDLREITGELNRYSNHRVRNLIFYDLDSVNLIHYDKDIFKEILYRID
jgi:hypothetical protein